MVFFFTETFTLLWYVLVFTWYLAAILIIFKVLRSEYVEFTEYKYILLSFIFLLASKLMEILATYMPDLVMYFQFFDSLLEFVAALLLLSTFVTAYYKIKGVTLSQKIVQTSTKDYMKKEEPKPKVNDPFTFE